MEKKVALITGGSVGIGFASAVKFAQNGYAVVIANRNEVKGHEALAKLKDLTEDAAFVQCDVSKTEECQKLVDATVEQFGRIDVLFNNAGVLGEMTPTLETSIDEAREVFNVDVFGTMNLIMMAGRVIEKQGKGVIINVSSINAQIAGAGPMAYVSAKGAVEALTRHAAKDLSPKGIRVVCIAPGWVRTEINRDNLANIPGMEATAAKLHMKGRIIEAPEIAEVVYFLASDAASCVNGSVVMCDDGYCGFKEGETILV